MCAPVAPARASTNQGHSLYNWLHSSACPAIPRTNNMSAFKTIINLLLFILGSSICIYGALHGIYVTTGFSVIAILLVHIAIVNFRIAEASIIIIAGIVGAFVETVNVSSGFYHYIAIEESEKFLPNWIVLIWFLIGSTARHGLAIFYKNKILLPVVCVIGASLIYLVGTRSGVLHFTPLDYTSIVGSIVLWAIALIFILIVGNRFIETIQR